MRWRSPPKRLLPRSPTTAAGPPGQPVDDLLEPGQLDEAPDLRFRV
ncbi:hypothetical protein [Streptomyces sp. NPDC093060]